MAIVTALDVAAIQRGLARLLDERAAGMADVTVEVLPSPHATGFSSETVLFDAAYTGDDGLRRTRPLVARIEPAGYSLYQEHDLATQWRVIDALHRHTDVPVPGIVAHATDGQSPLGRAAFVMERATGAAAGDAPPYTVRGWLHDAAPADQRAVYERGLDVLVAIHAVDWRRLGLDFLLEATANPVGLAAQVAHDEAFTDWVLGGRRFEQITAARQWLADHVPETESLRLSWGDARPGNMLFDAMRPTAVLDWEMVTVADPAADVSWWLVFNQIHTIGIGKPSLPGIPDDAGVVAYYEQQAGATITDLHFYEVRAALRAALLLVKYTDALVAAGRVPADAPRQAYTPALNVLDHLLG